MLARLADAIVETLRQNRELVAATIISRQGSTPRNAGTKMLIFQDGGFLGTIGGGLFESKIIERAGRVMAEGRPAFMSFDLTSQDVAAMDMICGGRLEVFLDLLRPDENTLAVFEAWLDGLTAGRPGFMVTAVTGDEPESDGVAHALVEASGRMTGRLPFSRETLDEALQEAAGAAALWLGRREGATVLVEPTLAVKTAYFIGAGHVSMPAAHLAALTGFRVVVVDDRPEFANQERFPDAAQVEVIPDFDHCLEGRPVDDDSFIVIVTRGHLHDKGALTQALKTRAGYIGMIGSRRKRDAIYQALLNEGFTEDDLRRVHSPIGLNIDAETPEELAVCILAEMIQVRARLKKV